MEQGGGRFRPPPFLFGGKLAGDMRPLASAPLAASGTRCSRIATGVHGGQEWNPSGIPAAAITTRCIPEQRVPIAVLWSVPAFLLLTPGGTPPLRRSPLLAACHLRLRSPKIVCEIRFTSDGPWTRILATGRPPRFEFCSKKPPTRGVMKESELWSDASLRFEAADKRNRIRR